MDVAAYAKYNDSYDTFFGNRRILEISTSDPHKDKEAAFCRFGVSVHIP